MSIDFKCIFVHIAQVEKGKNMDEEARKKAVFWIESKKSTRACDCCSHNSWTLSEDVVTTPILANGSAIFGGKSYPYVMLICNNCGNTKFFNAVKMGILNPANGGPAHE